MVIVPAGVKARLALGVTDSKRPPSAALRQAALIG
jgi:hypothetical protein